MLCRLTRTAPSLLLHPTDFLGCEDTRDLSFIPGMSLPSEQKMEFVSEILHILCEHFTVVTLQQHALQLVALPLLDPTSRAVKIPEQQPV